MDLASAEAEIRHVFGDTPITEASIGAAPPDILVKLSVGNQFCKSPPLKWLQRWRRVLSPDVIKLSGYCVSNSCHRDYKRIEAAS